MVILAGCMGLRVGEILGLQWGDVTFLNGTLEVRRSVYQYHIRPAKTRYSEAALPTGGGNRFGVGQLAFASEVPRRRGFRISFRKGRASGCR
jgi:integrase